MLGTIQKWGNSNGVRIPKKILDNLNIKENQEVEIIEHRGNILIKKRKKEFSSLEELFQGYEKNYKCEEFDFGEDMGLENYE